jgi:hypothetical protein
MAGPRTGSARPEDLSFPLRADAARKKDSRLKAEDDALNHQKLAGSPAERNLLISGANSPYFSEPPEKKIQCEFKALS